MKCSRILCLLLVLLTIPLFTLTAWADEGTAALHALHFDIALQEDGSAWITETRELVFSGDRAFTRYGVNNTFTGPRTMTGWQVCIDGTPAPQLDVPDHENRPENTFAVEDGDGGNTVYVYFRQQGGGTRVFEISYRVENAVKLHDDVGEFFWNLTGTTGISDIGTLTATLTAPEGAPAEELHIWAHGPQSGTFDKQPDGSAALRAENVPLGTIVDIRATLPASCFTGGWVQPGEALPDILAQEQALADSANAERDHVIRTQEELDAFLGDYWVGRRAWAAEHPTLESIQSFCESVYLRLVYTMTYELGKVVAILGALVFGLTAFIGRLLHRPERLRHTPAQSPRYCEQLPDERPAPVVDRLVHFYDGKPDVSRQISATLLELNRKGLVELRTVDGKVELTLNAQLGGALYPPTEGTEKGRTPDEQEVLWNFLTGAADGSGRMSMKALQQYILDNQSASCDFRKRFESAVARAYGSWVKTEVVKRPLFSGSGLLWLLPVLVGILAMLVRLGSTLYEGIEPVASIWVGVKGVAVTALLVVIFHLGKRFALGRCVILDQQSEDDLARWQAFGRYLDDFEKFDEKKLPDFSVWRQYMVYAVATGRGQTVAEALSLRYPEAPSTYAEPYEDELYRLMREQELYRAMESMGREVAVAREPAPVASSSGSGDSSDSWNDNWSDGSGDGGGFSDSGGGSDSGSGGDFID